MPEGKERLCLWCGSLLTGRSTLYCNTQHGALFRKDEAYFGGHLRDTIGWDTRECQICGKKEPKRGGFQSHHVYGRQNDPEGNWLVLLCPGCHQAVTIMGNRIFFEDAWAKLISYATLRKRGPEHLKNVVVQVIAEIEEGE